MAVKVARVLISAKLNGQEKLVCGLSFSVCRVMNFPFHCIDREPSCSPKCAIGIY
jgi:hypothetical protein